MDSAVSLWDLQSPGGTSKNCCFTPVPVL